MGVMSRSRKEKRVLLSVFALASGSEFKKDESVVLCTATYYVVL